MALARWCSLGVSLLSRRGGSAIKNKYRPAGACKGRPDGQVPVVLNAMLAVLLSLQVSHTSVRITGFVVASGLAGFPETPAQAPLSRATPNGPPEYLLP